MSITHKLDGTQVRYGYIWGFDRATKKYESVFPKGEFDVILQGANIGSRRFDRKRGRVSIGKKAMRRAFRRDDIVSISRSSDGAVVVTRVPGVAALPPAPSSTQAVRTDGKMAGPAP